MASGRPSRRMAIINGVLTVLALGLLAAMVYGNREKLQDVWARSPDWRLFVLALAIYVVALLVTFARWYRLVAALGLPFRFRDAVRLGFIGNVFNLVIPGAVGGDVVKAAFLCREQERRTQAVASMFVDRALGLLGLFVLAAAVGAVAWSDGSYQVRRLVVSAWALTACGVIGLTVLFSPTIYSPILARLPATSRFRVLFAELVTMASAYRRRIRVVFLGLAMAVLGHSLFVVAFFVVDRAMFGASTPDLFSHFVVVPLVLLGMAIPLPFGAAGVTEALSQTLFGTVVGFEGGAVAMLGYRVIMYSAGLVSVLVYAANLSQVRALKAAGAASEA